MAHTPGPWTIAPYHSLGAEQDIIAPNGQRVCSVAGSKSFDEDTNEWIEPDAHLIAAAPDLLAALKAALPYLEHSVKFYRYQQAGHEFWPNREEAEGNIRDGEAALAKAKELSEK